MDDNLREKAKADGWYTEDLKTLEEPIRKIFEEYSGISPQQIVPHIQELVRRPRMPSKFGTDFLQRKRAWDVKPYMCIAQARFLSLNLPHHPLYPEVLERMMQQERLLDLGCCLGQDIRKLAFDGVPSENIYGVDIEGSFIELGYELFLDKTKLNSKFLTQDFLDPQTRPLGEPVDIVHASAFFHLFTWDDQIQIGKRLVQTLRPKAGALLLGRQAGTSTNAAVEHTDLQKSGGSRLWHSIRSFQRLWKDIGDTTNTFWKVDVFLEEDPALAKFKNQSWYDSNLRRLCFAVRRKQ